MVEIKTLVLERIFLISQTPFSHFPNYVTYKADIVLFFANLRAFFSKDTSCQVFFFDFGSSLREVYQKHYCDDNKDDIQQEVFFYHKNLKKKL